MSIRELIPWRTRTPSLFETEHPLSSLRREMDELFSDFVRSSGWTPTAELGSFLPPVNVSEDVESFRVTAELPGMDLKDVTVRLESGNLVLSGKKESEKEEKGRNWTRRERSAGEFRRVIALPFEIQEDKITATFGKGVLTVDVPKAREAIAKSREISVKSA